MKGEKINSLTCQKMIEMNENVEIKPTTESDEQVFSLYQ